jgi:hypothetical protein
MPSQLARVPSPSEDEATASAVDDSLLSFQAEAAEGPQQAPAATTSARRYPILIPVATMTVLALAAVAIAYFFQMSNAPAMAAPAVAPVAAAGNVTFTSEPAGATVLIDGVARGVTPLKLRLAAGQHEAELMLDASKRKLPLIVDANTVMAQHVEFAGPAVADTGRLEVTSDPSGARVSIDGVPRGSTPLSVPAIAVGEHRITVSIDQTTVQRSVDVSAGATATVMAALATAGTAGGWARIESTIELQVYDDGQLIGTTSASRLMLPAGRHELEVANAALEFRAPIRVEIQPGRTTPVPVPIPNGSLSINALPWAEVLIDRRPAGTTPLGNLSVPIGTHEVVWRHPQFGERTRTVSVPARTPIRVGVDFTR